MSANSINSKADDILRHLAFSNSLQPNIVTIVSTGKIILANKAACKLLGYSMKELLTKSRSDIFDVNESRFKKLLKQRSEDGGSMGSVTVLKKGGKPIPCEITSSVFVGAHGIKKAITTITSMHESVLKQKKIDFEKEKIVAENIVLANSKQKIIDIKKQKVVDSDIKIAKKKSDARLIKENQWIKNIAKTSYDVMWDWNIITGQIYVGDSIHEMFGYKVKNNTVKFERFILRLLPKDRTAIKKKLLKTLSSSAKSWSDAYILRKKDGSFAATTSRAIIIRNDEGKAIRLIGATQDVSRIQELEIQLKEQVVQKKQSDQFDLTAKLSYDGIWEWNILTNEFFLGEGFKELFGYANMEKSNTTFNWSNYLHPEEKESIEKSIQAAVVSEDTVWEHANRFIRADGSIANVFGRASIIRDNSGKAYRMIGVIHDLSRQKKMEKELLQQVKLKAKQIIDATIDAKEIERANIGKELHDNVNQLLNASKMFLDMAMRGGENSSMYINRSSEYTLTAIEEIRKLTRGLTTDIIKDLGLCAAIESITEDIMEVNPLKISCSLKVKESGMNEKFKLNVFRITQEHLTNILKHSKAKKVNINLSQDKQFVRLTISDDGIGFDTAKKRKGIGISNIINRATIFNGKTDFISEPSQGCILTVLFPVTPLIIE